MSEPRVYRVGFTGTREGMRTPQKASLNVVLVGVKTACESSGARVEFRHGDCVGADAEAHGIAERLGFYVVGHPPTDPALRAWCNAGLMLPPKPYLDRNRDIVDAAHQLIACPLDAGEQRRGGTWYTVRYARKQGVPVTLILPDGTIREE